MENVNQVLSASLVKMERYVEQTQSHGKRINVHHANVKVSNIQFSMLFLKYNIVDGSIICNTKTCEEKTCEVGQHLDFIHSSSNNTCCPEQICVPDSITCDKIQKPECGPFQKIVTVQGPNNCPSLVCGKQL